MAILIPDLLYRDDAFHAGLALEVDEANGRIVRIGEGIAADAGGVVRLPGRALMPGCVNAHSHAFQRVIRGRTQWRPADDRVANFWSWRDAMYAAVLCLTPDDIYDVSRYCFIEMLRAGITTVGEFHYLQRDEAGRPYAEPNELASRVLSAAADAGIRICLLNVCYATGDVGEPLRPEQRRFATPNVQTFLEDTTALRARVGSDPRASVGVAPHSVRALPRAWLREVFDWASEHDVPLHMHVSEQTGEVSACVRRYGMRPVELLHTEGLLGDRFTAVHATHIDDREVALIATSGATVCACPATERDLGDGVLRGADLLRAGGRIALGTDSQTIIDLFEEARLVEYIERLQRRERVVLTDAHSGRLEVGSLLMRMAGAAGAHALRLRTGVLEAGAHADIAAIDLEHRALAGWSADTLAATLMLCAPSDVVRDVWVGGRAVVRDGVHALEEDSMAAFNRVARRVFALA